MKKILSIMAGIALAVMAMVSLSACGDDEPNEQSSYFTCGIGSLSYSGDSENEKIVLAYMGEVYQAYLSALSMTEADNTLILNQDYNSAKSEMKSKFDKVNLPEAPVVRGSYSFTITLQGCDLTKDKDTETVAEKTFSNN